MASVLSNFPTNSRANSPGYDWDTWAALDETGFGPVIQLERGEDFEVPAERMRMVITNHASRNNMRVQTSVRGETTVILQFRAREAVAA